MGHNITLVCGQQALHTGLHCEAKTKPNMLGHLSLWVGFMYDNMYIKLLF